MSESPPNDFRALGEDRYVLHSPHLETTFEVDRLRRTKHQLVGELLVRCALPGATTVDGVLSVSELNLSSQRARATQAQYLARRARTNGGDVDWLALVEELSQRVLTAERHGSPAVDLRTVSRPEADDTLDVDGLVLPRRHPSIIFGDGGTAKSYLLLYYLGSLACRGFRVGLADWELDASDHRDRLERLFGSDMPAIAYLRCDRPLVYEVDRLRRTAREYSLDYIGFDSIAFACDGPPESAEEAGKYFRAVRQIGCGSFHIAHTNKSEESDRKPFGSAFWFNGARSIWFARLAADTTLDGDSISLGLYPRKSNLGAMGSSAGFEITFGDDSTRFHRIRLADVPDLAQGLSLPQRIRAFLRSGARTREEISEEFEDVRPETLRRSINRAVKSGQLIRFPTSDGEQIGVAQ